MSDASAKIYLDGAKAVAARPSVHWSKQVVASANRELERHQLWVERHHQLYADALNDCQRQLERQNLISACIRAIILPLKLLASVCAASLHSAWALPRRFRMRAELQSRINAMDQLTVRSSVAHRGEGARLATKQHPSAMPQRKEAGSGTTPLDNRLRCSLQ
jgi:hypothetical protein